MAGRHETISDFERMGSQMGSAGQAQFPYEPRTLQENASLNNGVLDPIQRLPPEVSIIIIQGALPPDGLCAPQLLDLTSVSQIWRNFLLTTPVLWSEIYLNEGQPDFLATIATFVHLSGQAALRVGIYDHPIISWASLSSILAPAHQRITSLTVLSTGFGSGDKSERITSVVSDIFDRLGPLLQLQDLVFVDQIIPTISLFESLDLPSTTRLFGLLELSTPPSPPSSARPRRFFDICKYNSFGSAPFIAPLFRSCTVSLEGENTYKTTVEMGGEVLSHLKRSSTYITDLAVNSATAEYGLERLTHSIGTNVCHLDMDVSLSDIDNVVSFLRLLTRLEDLTLGILESELEGIPEIAPSSIVVPQLRSLEVMFTYRLNLPSQTVAQSLRGLFSVLTPLYPGVESLSLEDDTWSFSASSYMESLRRLKYLHLSQGSHGGNSYSHNRYDAENDPITLNHLERLQVVGQVSIHRLRTPNLLSLRLANMAFSSDLERLGVSCLRILTIWGESHTLNPSDFPVLSELELTRYEALKAVDILLFSSLRSIRLNTNQFTNPEGNTLCTALLYYPKLCPSLQELHFNGCLEWDILCLMLERRNFGLEGVKRIHTITLLFVPFLIHQTLTRLLTGATAARPPLESISVEATRELLFDPTVPGCGFCLKNMVPACRSEVCGANHLYGWKPDEFYPEYRYRGDAVPDDILDWMDHRKHLVDMWKSSCEEFQLKFRRQDRCYRNLYYGVNPYE